MNIETRHPAKWLPLALPVCLAFAVQRVDAQITYLSADRNVSVSTSVVCYPMRSDSKSDSTTDHGPYSADLLANTSGEPVNCTADAGARASQMTDLQAWSIGGSGNASSGAFFQGGPKAFADSTLSVQFVLSRTYPYTLSGIVGGKFVEFENILGEDIVDEGPGQARVVLSDRSGVIHEAQQTTIAEMPFSFSGTLVPGTYMLQATTATSAIDCFDHDESFDFQFELVPEPCSGGLLLAGLLGTGLICRRRMPRTS